MSSTSISCVQPTKEKRTPREDFIHVIESRKKNVYAANSTGEKKTSISAKQEQSWKEYTM